MYKQIFKKNFTLACKQKIYRSRWIGPSDGQVFLIGLVLH